MSETVRVNYDELEAVSKKFHDEADDIAFLHSSTLKKVNELRTEWIGEAATKFFNEMDGELLPALRRVVHALIFANDVLKRLTQIINEADQETAAYFDNLEGGDYGAGKIESVLEAAGIGGALGAAGGAFGGDSGTGPAGTPIQGPANIATQGDPALAKQSAAQDAATAGAAAQAGGGGGGGGSGGGGSGLQGDLKKMGAGMDAGPAQNAQVGGSQGGVENLPVHDFGSSGGGGGTGPAGSAGGSGAGSGGSAGAEGGSSSGGSVVEAGVAGVAGSAAIGAAAKVIKDNQDE